MTKVILASLLLATAVPALGQQSTTSLPPPVLTNPKVAVLRDNALENDHYAWGITEGLTTEVGQRLAATEAEAARPGLGRPPPEGDGFRERPRRALHYAGLDPRRRERRDRFPVPAEAGDCGTRLQWLDRTGRRHRPDRLFRKRRCLARCTGQRGSGQDRFHRPPHDARPGWLGLWSVRRAEASGADDRV